MKNIYFSSLVAVAISSLVSACGKKHAAALASMADLDGTWVEACSADSDGSGGSSKTSRTYSSGAATMTYSRYMDPSCTTETRTIKFVGTYKGGSSVASPAGAKEKDSTLVKLVINLKTDDGVADLNGAGDSSPFCGGGFVKNTAKELSATVCANDADTKKLFDTDYSVYKIDGSKLYFGHCGETGSVNDCSTAAKRATTLDTEEYFTKG